MRFAMFAAVLLFCLPAASQAAEPLVDVAWVSANLDRENVRFVDLRRSLRRNADREALAQDLDGLLRRTLMVAA